MDDFFISDLKTTLRLTTDAFDHELGLLFMAAIGDLELAGINPTGYLDGDPLIMRAIITYCRMNFGSPADYERLKESYDEQKAQLQMATGYGFL